MSDTEASGFAPLKRSRTALLSTFRRNGDGVSTPVSIALDTGRAYFATAATSGKAKRLAHCSRVSLAPCTVSGTPLGETVYGQAVLIEGRPRLRVRRLVWPGGRLFWSFLLYRLRGHTMNLYEVAPDPG